MNLLTDEINTYFACLIITIWGALATVLILHAVDSSIPLIIFGTVLDSTVTY